MGKLNKSMFSSKDQTWETPKELFNKLDNAFNFKLDVCAVPETAKCEKYFTPETNGLEQDWKGICWMNPPYGREQVKWITKAKDEAIKHNSTIACLIPARPDTKVWHDVIFKNANQICFIKGRLKFGDSKDSAPFPSALVIFGDINNKQKETLDSLGMTFKVA
ncbi:DNA N-6-adenine-methyltransferase [Clostridium perfringens]|uniref:DNA N-6-adenine-methyltransferase n=1 Tax=Clostridium perfringens TaxID=1502 RepID=UPI003BACAA5B